MDSMFEQFSSGYYLGRLYVEPRSGGSPAIARAQHEQVNRQLYASGEGVERTDVPLVMKLENTHLAVDGEEGVPEDTLVVPESLLGETRIRNPPALREVFLAKADRARQLLSVADGTPAVETALPGADDGDGSGEDPGGPDWFDRGGPTGV